jgi:hypothetical protein
LVQAVLVGPQVVQVMAELAVVPYLMRQVLARLLGELLPLGAVAALVTVHQETD